MKKIIKDIKKRLKKGGMYRAKLLYGVLYDHVRVNKNYILYESFHGVNFTGNPYALFKELIKEKKYKHIIVLNAYDENNLTINNIIKQYGNRVKIIKRNSDNYVYYLLKCKYLINNTSFHFFFNKKENQVYINTWHGTPIKTLGKDVKAARFESGNITKNFLHTDYFIEPNEFTTNVFFRSLDIDTLYNKGIIKSGYPRNDVFYSAFQLSDEIVDFLKIDKSKKTILYAPTYRGAAQNLMFDDYSINLGLLESLNEITKEYNILFKGHQFIAKDIEDKFENFIVVPNWLDTNELLTKVDILISDYSSIIIDFMNTRKPIIYYVPDEEQYKEMRGMYLRLEELPGEKCYAENEVLDVIKNIERYIEKYESRYHLSFERFCSYEDGSATNVVIDVAIRNNENTDKLFIPNQHSEKKRLLVYGGAFFMNGITTSFITFLKQLNYQKYDVYLLKTQIGGDNLKRLKETIDEIPELKIISHIESYNFTLTDWIKKYKKIRNPKSYVPKDMWASMFERESKKHLGDYFFDIAIDYSGYGNRFHGLFAFTNSKKKVIYLHNNMVEESKLRSTTADYPLLFELYKHKYDKLVTVSLGANNDLIKLYPKLKDKLVEINNPVDLDGIEKKLEDKHYEVINIDFDLADNEVLTIEKNYNMSTTYNINFISYTNQKLVIKGQINTPYTRDITLSVDNRNNNKSNVEFTYSNNGSAFQINDENVSDFSASNYRISVIYKTEVLHKFELKLPNIEQRIDNLYYEGKNIVVRGWLAIEGIECEADNVLDRKLLVINKFNPSEITKIAVKSYIQRWVMENEKFKNGDYSYCGFVSEIENSNLSNGTFELYLQTRNENIEVIFPIRKFSTFASKNKRTFDMVKYINNSDKIDAHLLGNKGSLPSKENINFVSVGRFENQKGYDMLIEAFGKLSMEFENVRFYLIGFDKKSFGNLSKTLYKELIIKNELQNKFLIVGKLNNPMAFMSMCDCFVMSSRYEGQGLVLFEGMLSGLTCISTDIAGPDSILSKEYLYDCSIEGIYQGMKDYCEGKLMPNKFDIEGYQKKYRQNIEILLNS
jgi:CDP-glycerol glycerophosphotransferase